MGRHYRQACAPRASHIRFLRQAFQLLAIRAALTAAVQSPSRIMIA
jgi:hypothetical protein